MYRILVFVFIYGLALTGIGQSLKIGDWSIHLNYTNINTATSINGLVYIGTQSGLFLYDSNENSLTTFSKLDGLNGHNVQSLAHDPIRETILIGYKDGNIDILKDGLITNLPDIYLSNIIGDKSINSIFIDGKFAYLSCSFGLVIVNLEKREIKETCYFENEGVNAEVYQVYVFDDEINSVSDSFLANKIFVATNSGLFFANKSDNLLDFSSWEKNSTISFEKITGSFNFSLEEQEVKQVLGFDLKENGGKKLAIVTNLNFAEMGYPMGLNNEYNFFELNTISNDNNNTSSSLLIFNYKETVPGKVIRAQYNAHAQKTVVITIFEDNNNLIILDPFLKTSSYLTIENLSSVDFNLSPSCGIVLDDYNNSGRLFLGDEKYGGLVLVNKNKELFFSEYIAPNGPADINTGVVFNHNNSVVFTHGGRTSDWNNAYNYQEFSVYSNNYWSASDTILELGVYDIVSGCSSGNKFFLGSWNKGLLEFQGTTLTQLYNEQNTEALMPAFGTSNYIRIGGIDTDSNNNLWITNSQSDKPLVKYSPENNSWSNYPVAGISSENDMSGKILCASNGQKWIQLRKNGVIVVEEEGGQAKKINESNGLASNTVNCFSEDKDGAVWIGTSQGLSVVFFPNTLFNSQSIEVEYILIETDDGYVERLFENTEILDIKTDDANRKWVATKSSGVFLVSEDGSEQIHHFTKENSFLLDNMVYDINIVESSGEVFFATNKGLCSFRSDATTSFSNFNDVIVFPNPVKRDYEGLIAISGLEYNTVVKITDVSGNLVYETISNGGTATWDGKRFDGAKVSTGVYLFLCTSSDFEKSVVKKVLIYN